MYFAIILVTLQYISDHPKLIVLYQKEEFSINA